MGGAGEMVRALALRHCSSWDQLLCVGWLGGGEGHVEEEVKDGPRGCVLPF